MCAVASLQGLRRRVIVVLEGPSLRTEDGIDVVPFATFASLLATDSL